MIIPERLARHARERSDHPFLMSPSGTLTYSDLYERSRRTGAWLAAQGVTPGDRVALLLQNRPEFLVAFFGAQFAGAIAVPINTLLKPPEVEFILHDAQAAWLVTERALAPVAAAAIPGDGFLRGALVLDPEAPLPVRTVAWTDHEREATALGDPGHRLPRLDSAGEAGIIYTSGTTGKPKGVVLTHANYAWDAAAIATAAGMTAEDRFLCVLPLFHVNAQVVTTMAPISAGGSMILLEKFSPAPFLDALGRFGATAFSAVPTIYAILNGLPDEQVRDLSRLRVCICGAAPMPVEVFETFERKYRARILEGYGLSEGTCASSVNPLQGRRKVGSVGLPLPGQEMRIVDDSGRPVEPGRVGEIVVRGPNVMKGYFRNPTATAETLRDGWLHTGDLGTQDLDGYFFIVGRKKEMIIRGGENIYPREVEEALHRLPGVRECAVVGVPDPKWGEEVVAAIVPDRVGGLDEAAVQAHCRKWLADYKSPRRVCFVTQLPRTATGKVQKHELVRSLEEAARAQRAGTGANHSEAHR